MLNSVSPVPPSDRVSLKQRVLNACTWTLASFGLTQAIRFGSNLLLTRLLVPEMFGIMAIASIVMVGLAMLSDVGLKQNIVQSKRGDDPAFLNTAWVIQIVRGILLCFLALSISLLVFVADRTGIIPKYSAYADPKLPYVIATLSFTALIAGFQSTKLFEASRNLSLKDVARIEIITQVSGLLIVFGWIAFDRSIWALVAGSICSAMASTLLSHVWLPGVRNRWMWQASAFQEIFHFGKWMFISSILGFIVNNGDRLLLAGLIDSTLLGIYVIAFGIVNAIEQLLNRAINDIAFPALSEVLRERAAHLKAHFYRFHIVIGCFACFCSGILMFSGQSVIGFLYDRRYEQAGWMLEILAGALLIIPVNLAIVSLLALGLPRLFTQLIAVRAASLFLLVPLGFQFYGMSGAVCAIVVSYFSILPATVFYQTKFGLFDFTKEMLPIPAWIVGAGIGKIFTLAVGH